MRIKELNNKRHYSNFHEIVSVLGNHDYTGNALAQLDPAIRKVDSRYTVIAKSFIVNSGQQIMKECKMHAFTIVRKYGYSTLTYSKAKF